MIRCQYCLCCVDGEIMKWRIYFVVPLQTSKAFAVRTVKGAIRSEVKVLRTYGKKLTSRAIAIGQYAKIYDEFFFKELFQFWN